jgi:hypothetical protein
MDSHDAVTVEFGQIHAVVRRGRQVRGFIVRIEDQRLSGHWTPVLKIDAFGTRPHWHLYGGSGRENATNVRSTIGEF